MLKLELVGKVFSASSEEISFLNKRTNEVEKFMKHQVEFLVEQPSEGIVHLQVQVPRGDAEGAKRFASVFSKGATVKVPIIRFGSENGATQASAWISDCQPVGAKR